MSRLLSHVELFLPGKTDIILLFLYSLLCCSSMRSFLLRFPWMPFRTFRQRSGPSLTHFSRASYLSFLFSFFPFIPIIPQVYYMVYYFLYVPLLFFLSLTTFVIFVSLWNIGNHKCFHSTRQTIKFTKQHVFQSPNGCLGEVDNFFILQLVPKIRLL